MIQACDHPREPDRIAVLRRLGILDTAPEPDFDGVVALAAAIAGVPIALVSLVDERRQWFKARHGLDASETPRDVAFCAHAILDPDHPFVIEDAETDPRFCDNPLVVGGPRVVFYAGVPLRAGPDHLPIGTLCVIDHQARHLQPHQLDQLRLLARQTEMLLDLRLRQTSMEDRLVAVAEEEQRLRSLIAAMDEGMVVQARDGRITACNPAAERILGLNADQLMGLTSMDPRWRTVREDGSPFPGDQHPSMVALASGRPVRRVLMGVGVKPEAERWILINAEPFDFVDGVPRSVVATFSDVTDLRATERALRAAKESAESATRAKSEFLATMSHEIRTPMNGVMGLTELLLDSPLNDDQRSMLSTVQESGRALLAILNDILDWSRIEAGRMDLERVPVDALQVVRDVTTLLEPQARAKGLAIACTGGAPAILADAGRLRQILFNLVGNAVKFTQRGRVDIHIEPAGDRCRIRVQDTGIGIPADRIPQLFQRFSQIDASRTRQYGGSGLGLAISRQLAELMGGGITVASEAGQGSVFTLELPIAAVADPAVAATDPAPRGPARPLRLLLVEDHPVNRRVATALLRRDGHAVEVANDGREALAHHQAGTWDAILMDIQMPVMDGLEATAEIRRREQGARRTPVIALTASSMPEEIARCRTAGMDLVLGKPIELAALRRALAAVVPG
ncbi:MAG: hypothetical protein RLZZ127_1204 [Planctomycetota bacterium]|jgi:PAS domain S-box-containing protein